MVDNILRNGRRFYRPPSTARSCRSSSRARCSASATPWCGRRTAPTSPANRRASRTRRSSSGSSSIRRRAVTKRGDRDDLMGGARAPRRFVGWTTFFRFPGFEADAAPNKRIDTTISIAAVRSAAVHDRQRRAADVAAAAQPAAASDVVDPVGSGDRREMEFEPLDRSELDDIGDVGRENGVPNLDASTPLWFYIFREAEHRAGSHDARASRWSHCGRGHHRPAADGSRLVPQSARGGVRSCPRPAQSSR